MDCEVGADAPAPGVPLSLTSAPLSGCSLTASITVPPIVHFSCGSPAFCAAAEHANHMESTIGMAIRSDFRSSQRLLTDRIDYGPANRALLLRQSSVLRGCRARKPYGEHDRDGHQIGLPLLSAAAH